MKIYQALKYKKKLQSEIGVLWNRLNENNSINIENTRNYEPRELFLEIIEKQDELVRLKISLQKTNKNIFESIFKIAELKSRTSYLRGINIKNGKFSNYGDTPVEFESDFKQVEIDSMISGLEKEIGKTQEEIDQFNIKTNIAW